MREFFRGWRRKVGVVTLVMASLFAAGWVRSIMMLDIVIIPSGPFVTVTTISNDNYFGVQYHRRIDPPNGSSIPTWKHVVDSTKIKRLLADRQMTWHGSIGGFRRGEIEMERPGQLVVYLIPYWSITVPLTLVSFWLLLSALRKSTPKKIVEPIPVEGT